MTGIDLMTDCAHSARVDDHVLGGETDHAADRVADVIPDDAAAGRVERSVADLLPPGSCLALTSATDDVDPGTGARVRAQYAASGVRLRTRSRAETERFVDGLELVDPGVAQVRRWHDADPRAAGVSSGVARKP